MNTIYLADDDKDDCEFFVEALKELSLKTELSILNDGVELMTKLNESVTEPPPPHIIFLDLNMPRKNGYECLKEIRETPKLKKIPVVIFSTTANQDAIETTYSLGANCYIRKPTSHKLLLKIIETVLNLNFGERGRRLSKNKYFLKIS
ncbi:MAG: response regulator [Saprospiraceae bacterium]|nr:response regulator [Saprospiraceae bacterium]